MSGDTSAFWLRRASSEALRFNFGWWLQKFLPWVVVTGLVAAIACVFARTWEMPVFQVVLLAACSFVIGAIVSWRLARPRFLSRRDALARLDADLRLHNALTSANEGRTAWPGEDSRARFALQWKWSRLLWPPAAAALLVVIGWGIPLPRSLAGPRVQSEPSNWTAVQQKLDELRKEKLVQSEPLEEMQRQLDALRREPSGNWYNHESLEAGDHLQAQTDQALQEIQKNLQTALGVMEVSRQIEGSQLAAMEQPLDAAMQQALKGLESGTLPLNPDLLKQLKNLDPSKMRKLSAEECKKLSQCLREGISTCSGKYCENGKSGMMLLLALTGNATGIPARGPGAAPMSFNEGETNLGTKDTEAVSNSDLSHAAIGDMMGLQAGRHEVDKNAYSGPQAGGTMANSGSGGEAVWEQTATPEEQEALRKFFQ